MSKNTLVAALLGSSVAVESIAEVIEPEVSVEPVVEVSQPPVVVVPEEQLVTRGELEDHLNEDRAEHDAMREEIAELQRVDGIHDNIMKVLEASSNLTRADNADLMMSNIALESAGGQLGLVPPKLFASNGQLVRASLEDVASWAATVRGFVKSSASKLKNRMVLHGLRSEKTLELYRKRVAFMRKQLANGKVSSDGQVTMAKDHLANLIVGKEYSKTLPEDLSRFFVFASVVAKGAIQGYAASIEKMFAIERQLLSASTNVEFESVLKEVASKAFDFSFYQQIENGETVYLGGNLFKKPNYSGSVLYPQWFAPVLKMANCPGYEVFRVKPESIVNTHKTIQSLTTAECLAVLDAIDKGLDEYEVVAKVCLETMSSIWEMFEKQANLHIASTDVVSVEPISKINGAMRTMVLMIADYMEAPLMETTNVIDGKLSDSLFASLLLVELSLTGV